MDTRVKSKVKKPKVFGHSSLHMETCNLNLTYLEILAEHLVRAGLVRPDKWHTVQFYCKAGKEGGVYVDEFRVCSIKRTKWGANG